jgi:hypothetical protein
MTEASVEKRKGTYLFCDTDSLAIVASKSGGPLRIPGSEDVKILSWDEVQTIVDQFSSLNPYEPAAVKGSILNLVDGNFIDSDPKKARRQLYGYSIAAKRYALYEKTQNSDIKIVDPKAHGIGFLYPPKDSPKDWDEDVPQWVFEMWDFIIRVALDMPRVEPSWLNIPQMMRVTITTHNVLQMLGQWEITRPYNFLLLPMVDQTFGYAFDREPNEKVLLVCPFSSKQEEWLELECINVHNNKQYRMVDCTTETNPPHNVVFPLQFAHLLFQYQSHPEAKSLAPDDTACKSDTKGLLKRAHIVAGELRYIDKEADRKWEEGEDISVLKFKSTEYGREKRVIASEDLKNEINRIGIKQCAPESGFSRVFIRKLLRGLPVKRKSYDEVARWFKNLKLDNSGFH